MVYFLLSLLQKGIDKLWKIPKEMGVSDHLTCLQRNLYEGQEATVRTGHGTTDWSKIGKRVDKAIFCHLAYLTYMRVHHAKCQAGWITSWNQDCSEKFQQPRICRWYNSNGRKWRGASWWGWKRRVKNLTWISTLKTKDHGIWSHHFMTNRMGKSGSRDRFSFFGHQNHCRLWLWPWN